MPPVQAVACPLCGTAHAVCGQAAASTPLDIPTGKEPFVGPVRKYKVTTNGHETVLKLNDEDVKAYLDAELIDDSADDAGTADSTTAAADSGSTDDASSKTRTAANKSRRATGDKASG